MLVTAPTVARLTGHRRMWAHLAIKAGQFGPITKRGRADLVELREVERVTKNNGRQPLWGRKA